MIGAVDIGGTKIAVGVVDEKGQVLARRACPTEAPRGPVDAVQRINILLREASTEAGGELAGIGIGSTGPVYPESGRIGNVPFLPGWEDFDLAAALAAEFRLRVALENDADAAALGEWAWGAGRDRRTFILVTVGTGIGVGVILDGRLYRGMDGFHPEIGHHIIDPAGPECSCGARGCWEAFASGPAMEQWALADRPQHARRTARELCQLAEQGDELGRAAVERTARYLGLGLANLVNLFVPEMIALGGGLMQSQALFMPLISPIIGANCTLVPAGRVQIVPAALGGDTGLVGAARAWMGRYSSNR
jgi:glucokinase